MNASEAPAKTTEKSRDRRRRLARLLLAAGGSAAAVMAFVNGPAAMRPAAALAAAPESEAMTPSPAFAFRWTPAMAEDLLAEIHAAAGEGLDPAPYDAPALRAELARSAGSAALDALANAVALQLARDYWLGRVTDRAAFDWHIAREDGDPARLEQGLGQAMAQGAVRPWLRSLLPSDARYAALRDALAVTPAADTATRDRLMANMERWRWLPRDLGADHIYVNVPSYTLDLVEDRKPIATYTVVVGARSTPTPQIAMAASSVVVNPYWYVPASIIRSSRLRPGRGAYEYVPTGNGRYLVRQRPGPRNALGRIKIDMPNPHSIYLHDTPAKAYFERTSRAYSHGCIRVKDIDRLAEQIAELDRGAAGEVVSGLAGKTTRTVKLDTARPVWLVYFTMDRGADGQVTRLEDPYNRDARLIARLNGPTRIASRQQAPSIGGLRGGGPAGGR